MQCNPLTNVIDCHESVPMLTFVIDNYGSTIAKRFVFLHDHETSWHCKTPIYDRLKYLQTHEYWNREYGGIYEDAYSTDYYDHLDEIYPLIYKHVKKIPQKELVGRSERPCCATFFVDSQLLWRHTREEYMSVIDGLREWSRDYLRKYPDKDPTVHCGRVTEQSWLALFAGVDKPVPRPPR